MWHRNGRDPGVRQGLLLVSVVDKILAAMIAYLLPTALLISGDPNRLPN